MSIEEVRALVAERQRYDDWLAALEAKRADTPPRVFERVHGDYLGRRTDVIVRLQAHVAGLAALGDELQSRLAGLDAQLGAHEDELAEGMLRNLVGEYDGDRWEAVRQDIEAKITTLNGQRVALITEYDDVRTLLENARVVPEPTQTSEPTPDEGAAGTPTPTPVATTAVLDATPLVIPAVEDGGAIAAAGTASSGGWDGMVETVEVARPGDAYVAYDGAVDDITTEFTVVADAAAAPDALQEFAREEQGEELLDIDVSAMLEAASAPAPSHEDVLADVAALFDTSSITAVPGHDAASVVPGAPANPQEFDDALAMFGEAAGSADPQFVQSLEGIEAEHDAPVPRVDVSLGTPSAYTAPQPPNAHGASGPAANDVDPFDDLAFLRSVTGGGNGDASAEAPPPAAATASAAPASSHEPQKTLRCTECGTMNLPTEWYCERCGGELAAF